MSYSSDVVRRRRDAAVTTLLALALGGCVVGPNFKAPTAPQSTAYTQAELPNLNLAASPSEPDGASHQWWLALGSAPLTATIDQALKANRTLASARSTLAEAQELAAAAEGGRYPSVSANAGAGRQKYGAAFLGPERLPPFTYYSIGASVSYAFDYNGGVRRTVEEQRARSDYQQHEFDAAALGVSGNVALQALAAASARAQIETLQAVLKDDRDNLKLVQDAFDAGGATRVDVLNAQSQLANDATLLPPLRTELSSAEHALALLVGEQPAAWAPPQFQLEDFQLPARLPLILPSEMAHQRPDILAAEAQLHAATAAVGVADANLYPQISLSASAGLQTITLHTLFDSGSSAYGLSGNLVQPLFDHGALRAKQRAAVDAMHASLSDYEQVVLAALTQVADALEALEHDQELLDSEQRALATAAENLSLTRESYSAGNTGVLQVLEAERQDQQARLGLVRAQVQRLRDAATLMLALGGGGVPLATG